MSKTFKTLQELWSYCLWCPVCLDICREVDVSVGPDDFEVVSFEKENEFLTIRAKYKKDKKSIPITHIINCVSNVFSIDCASPELRNFYWYFYVQSDCRKCNNTYTNSTDLELDTKNKKICDIGVEREGIYLLSTKDKYHVTMSHDTNRMLVSKCSEDKDGMIVDNIKVCTLPIVDIDFSKPRKAANKIKTLIVFS